MNVALPAVAVARITSKEPPPILVASAIDLVKSLAVTTVDESVGTGLSNASSN